jgi:hypothetical protein
MDSLLCQHLDQFKQTYKDCSLEDFVKDCFTAITGEGFGRDQITNNMKPGYYRFGFKVPYNYPQTEYSMGCLCEDLLDTILKAERQVNVEDHPLELTPWVRFNEKFPEFLHFWISGKL